MILIKLKEAGPGIRCNVWQRGKGVWKRGRLMGGRVLSTAHDWRLVIGAVREKR